MEKSKTRDGATDPPIAAIADPDDRERAYLAVLMPVLRELGLATDGVPGDTNGSIVKAVARAGIELDSAEAAIRGLVLLWQAGQLRRFKPPIEPTGPPPSLRLIWAKPRDGPGRRTPFWREAEDAYWRELEKSSRKQAGGPGRIQVEVRAAG